MPMDYTLARRVLGVAEGTVFAQVDNRYVPSKASEQSGMSFGLTQLDASQGPGRRALKAILLQLAAAGTITAAERTALEQRYTGSAARQQLTTAEKVRLTAIFARPEVRVVIDAQDRIQVDDRLTAVANLMEAAAEYWRGRDGRTYPRLADPADPDYIELAAYIMATLNKRPDNRDMFLNFLQGNGATLRSGTIVPALNRPPFPWELHALQPHLLAWLPGRGNGDYGELIGRMQEVVPAHTTVPATEAALPPLRRPATITPLRPSAAPTLGLRRHGRHRPRHGASGNW